MHIPLEHFGSKLQSDSRNCINAHLDWPGLVARLAAAHATRRILAAQPDHQSTRSGSFAPAWAPLVAAHLAIASRQSDEFFACDVNQIPKADSKGPDPIDQNSRGKDPVPIRGPS